MGKLKYKLQRFADKYVPKKTYKRVQNRHFQARGMKWSSRKNSKNPYSVHLRFFDITYDDWLGWDSPHKEVWTMFVEYPTKFIDWVYSKFHIDLDSCSINEWFDFAEDTGLVIIKGDMPDYVVSEVRAALKIVLEFLRTNYNKIK